jgi:hypothetical protein
MSAEIVNPADGILTLKVAGKLTQPELAAAGSRRPNFFKSGAR